eukprot:2848261-Rhodomonas_salina.1
MVHFWDCQANKDNTNNSNITISISLYQARRTHYPRTSSATTACNTDRPPMTMSWRRGAALAEGQGVDLLD